ncbi:MAG TPA: YaiO family outer membrane beta-barrel protein, partial [Chitinophagaceae bacterium]
MHLNPSNQEALSFKEYLKKKITNPSTNNGAGVTYYYDYFKNTYSPWSFGSLYFFHSGKGGTVNTRINYASRFHVQGMQFELNAYPKISSSLRGLIGVAYSGSEIFPTYSLALGLYYKFLKKSELEGGVRYLHFKTLADPIYVFTAAYNKSFNRFFASVRTYLVPQPNGLNQSYYLTGRYYTKNKEKNISLTLNTGIAPHDYTDPVTNEKYNSPTHSKRIRIAFQTPFLSNKSIMRFSLGYE